MPSKSISSQTAEILIDINAVSFRFNPPFTFTSGIKSPIYLDNRIIMSYPEARRKIVEFYIEVIKEKIGLKNIDYISGTASAAIPQAAWIAGELNLPMVYVRPTTKSYGKGNRLEGYLKKGSRVIIIEDHISTATSVVNNAKTVMELGGRVLACIATTTYETSISKENLVKAHIKLYPLTTGRIIVETAFKKRLINKSQKSSVDSWFTDPEHWS